MGKCQPPEVRRRPLIARFRGAFRYEGLPNADVIAFVRNVAVNAKPGFCLHVLWAGQDQVQMLSNSRYMPLTMMFRTCTSVFTLLAGAGRCLLRSQTSVP